MEWYPLGPDFVFEPIRENFLRLSRRNERGMQGTVTHIAVSPHDANTILAIDAPTSGGSALHVSEDGGETWRSLLEPLHHSTASGFGSDLDPTCTAFHPAIAGAVYLGTGTKRTLYRSTAGFSGWSVVHTFAGGIREILIDPRTTTPATTTILVATTEGLFLTTNGGTDWASVLAGSIQSVSGDFPAAGAPSVWASVRGTGLFHSTDLTAWTNISTGAALDPGVTGALPSPASLDSQFLAFLVGFSLVEPQRVYAWAVKKDANVSLGLFRSDSGAAGPWTRIAAAALPDPWQGMRNGVFAVAPQSGNGTTDVLLFGGIFFNRSVDGGLTWETITHTHGAPAFHADFWSFAFAPPRPPFSGPPLLLVGCDGGIASSTNYAGSEPISTSPNLNEGLAVDASSPAFRALNRGRGGSALYAMATDPRIAQLNYIGCLDTGVARGSGGLGWRSFYGADAGVLAVAPGPDGVTVWYASGLFNEYPFFIITTELDRVGPEFVKRARFGSLGFVGATSNLLIGAGDACVGGLLSYTAAHTLLSDIPGGFDVHEFTLDSLDGIEAGATLMFHPDVWQRFPRVVEAIVDASTNRVRATKGSGGFPPGTPVKVVGAYVGRIDRTGVATPISQNLGLSLHAPFCVAIGPGSSTVAACATQTEDNLRSADLEPGTFDPNPTDKLFVTSAGTAAMSTWLEVTSGRPEGSRIANVAVDVAGTVFVLVAEAVGGTPLYRIDSGVWTAAPGSGAPSGEPPFGRLIAHPTLANCLYAVHGGRVYAIESDGGAWNWTDITGGETDGLPGTWVYDLWAGDIDPRPAQQKLILRAAVATRGVYETDITPGTKTPAFAFYLRDNVVDQGWLDESPSGIPNPRKPSENVWYWQCADLKIDAQRPEGFFQTDPEYPGGIDDVPSYAFDVMRDFTQQLPQNAPARVHVAVRRRSRVPSTAAAWVWALWTNAGAGLHALGTREDGLPAFDFWSLFSSSGINHALLPADSRWKPVGEPQPIFGVSADLPRVVTWDWTIPALPSPADPGHFCMIAIIHTSITTWAGTGTDVDAITRFHRQFGQKNLQVIGVPAPDLPPLELAAAAPAPATATLPAPAAEQMMTIEFHNPTSEFRDATLLFDLRNLAPSIDLAFHLSTNVTPSAVNGAKSSGVHRGCGCWPFRKRGEYSPIRYEATKGATVEVKGVHLSPGGSCSARLAVRVPPDTPPGEHAFDVLQVVQGQVVGGSTYVVVVPESARTQAPPPETEEREEGPEWVRKNVPYLMAPPWTRRFVRKL